VFKESELKKQLNSIVLKILNNNYEKSKADNP